MFASDAVADGEAKKSLASKRAEGRGQRKRLASKERTRREGVEINEREAHSCEGVLTPAVCLHAAPPASRFAPFLNAEAGQFIYTISSIWGACRGCVQQLGASPAQPRPVDAAQSFAL
jgi:hypothetical protein